MIKWFKKLYHRHTWRPLKVQYRYWDYRTGQQLEVKRCQCRECGKIEYHHFSGKNLIR